MTKWELREKARLAWARVRRGGLITEGERKLFLDAYWESALKDIDPDVSVAQWVEDGMPPL